MELKVGKTVEENDNILKLLHINDSLSSSSLTCKIFAVYKLLQNLQSKTKKHHPVESKFRVCSALSSLQHSSHHSSKPLLCLREATPAEGKPQHGVRARGCCHTVLILGIQLFLNGHLCLVPPLASLHQNRKQHYSEVEGVIPDYVKSKVNFVNVKKMNSNRLYKQTLIKDKYWTNMRLKVHISYNGIIET